MELAPDFDECIGFLTAHGVEFVVVGAQALAFHGARRFTGVLDIVTSSMPQSWKNQTLDR